MNVKEDVILELLSLYDLDVEDYFFWINRLIVWNFIV